VLALAIYQAAHITYLSQLEAAINAHPDINDEEKDNANSVLHHGFNQFREFAIFATLLPLILLERQNIPEADARGEKEEDLVRQCISPAWGKLFNKQVLLTDIQRTKLLRDVNEGKAPRGAILEVAKMPIGRDRVRCPATMHLQAASADRIIEMLFDTVVAHRGALGSELQRARQAAEDMALRPGECYAEMIQQIRADSAGARGGKGKQ
jgi:hypothetical protein